MHVLALMLALATSGASFTARAEGPPQAEPYSDQEVKRRIQFIEERLDAGTAAADRWWYSWFVIYTGLTVGQATIAIAATDPGLRIDNVVGALSSSLGVVPLGLMSFEPRFAADRLRAVRDGTPKQRRMKLVRAEALLRSAADNERGGRSWLSHLIGNNFALAVGVILGVGYDRPLSGVISFAGGLVVTEAQILSQPTQAIEDWRQYERHGPTTSNDDSASSRWVVVPQSGGLGVAGVF
jgi:hypothetical protein